jgi:hypothetical protein
LLHLQLDLSVQFLSDRFWSISTGRFSAVISVKIIEKGLGADYVAPHQREAEIRQGILYVADIVVVLLLVSATSNCWRPIRNPISVHRIWSRLTGHSSALSAMSLRVRQASTVIGPTVANLASGAVRTWSWCTISHMTMCAVVHIVYF